MQEGEALGKTETMPGFLFWGHAVRAPFLPITPLYLGLSFHLTFPRKPYLVTKHPPFLQVQVNGPHF